jgi:RNA polymerase sigma-70 factor (ECF subfamily)
MPAIGGAPTTSTVPGGAIMTEAGPSTAQLQGDLERMLAGDAAAREDLFRHVSGRLERLTRKMLHGFPGVHRWAQTDDVLQNALVRLLRALREVRPKSMREFFGLSAEQIRRELIDLARHYYGPEGLGANHASRAGREGANAPGPEQLDLTHEPSALAGWCEFHEQVRKLPDAEREVMFLLFYQELPQAEAAALLGVSVRAVQRRWQSALLKLHQVLKGQWPGL